MKTIKINDQKTFEKYLQLRKEVFVDEQHVDISLEIDHFDTLDNDMVDHFAYLCKDLVIGTCRGLRKKHNRVQLGRFAINQHVRHQGFGLKFLRAVELYYQKQEVTSVFLHAQLQALPFYQQAGYTPYGEEFEDAGIIHIACQKILKPSFYDQLAKYYDSIFPLTKPKQNLLFEWAQPLQNLLDVGCGSGLQAKFLQNHQKSVIGIDLSEDMIIQSQQKQLNVFKLDMLQINKLEKQFDGIYCLGNTLVHLDSTTYIREFFNQCYQALIDQGSLLIQIVNYDRILQQEITSLPTIRSNKPKLQFIRNYEIVNGHIHFHTVLYHQKKKYENTQKLYPLTSNELTTLLKQTGFIIENCYGSYQKDEYDPQTSESLIVIAKKNGDFYD